MLHTIEWFVRLGLEICAILFGLWIFGYILKNGTGALKELIRTIGKTIKALCGWITEKLSERKEPAKEKEEEEEPKYEVRLTRKQIEAFEKAMQNKETFTL